jgi:hypothetical protein
MAGVFPVLHESARPVVHHLRLKSPKRLHLDLADPLSCEPDFVADLLERERGLPLESEAEPDHPGIPFIDRVEKSEHHRVVLAMLALSLWRSLA